MMGWKNYETWNVTLWLANDEQLYAIAKRCSNKKQLVEVLKTRGIKATPDGVQFDNRHVNATELRQFLRSIK